MFIFLVRVLLFTRNQVFCYKNQNFYGLPFKLGSMFFSEILHMSLP